MRNLWMVGLVLMTGCGIKLVKVEQAITDIRLIEAKAEAIRTKQEDCWRGTVPEALEIEQAIKRLKGLIE